MPVLFHSELLQASLLACALCSLLAPTAPPVVVGPPPAAGRRARAP